MTSFNKMNKKSFFGRGKVIRIIDGDLWDYVELYSYDINLSLQTIINKDKSYWVSSVHDHKYNFLMNFPLLIIETGIYNDWLSSKETILLKILVNDRIEIIRNDRKHSHKDTILSIEVL